MIGPAIPDAMQREVLLPSRNCRAVEPGDDSEREVARHAFLFSRRVSPELCLIAPPSRPRGRREGRVPAAPAVCCAKRCTQETAQQHTGEAQHTAFPARWSDGLCRALPGAEFLLASLAPAKFTGAAPVDATAAFANA